MRFFAYLFLAAAFVLPAANDALADEPALPDAPAKIDLPPPSRWKPGRLQRGPEGQIILDNKPRQVRVCPLKAFKPGCNYWQLGDALANVIPKDLIVLAPGIYRQGAVVDVPNLTIRGEPGAHLRGWPVRGKAALVVTADDVVIDGIECSNITVPDQNGACIRIEAANLTVRNVYFHDNQEGILGGAGGTLLVENSRFERNGFGGRAHGVYISRKVESFVFRNNRILETTGAGHGFKSRAQQTIIENNVIASLDGHDSRAIDIPNGGDVVIRGNIFQKGPNSENHDMIGLALEEFNGGFHPLNKTLIENNIFIFDRPEGQVLRSESPGEIVFHNNTVIGASSIGAEVTQRDNDFFENRESAGIAAYPALPQASP